MRNENSIKLNEFCLWIGWTIMQNIDSCHIFTTSAIIKCHRKYLLTVEHVLRLLKVAINFIPAESYAKKKTTFGSINQVFLYWKLHRNRKLLCMRQIIIIIRKIASLWTSHRDIDRYNEYIGDNALHQHTAQIAHLENAFWKRVFGTFSR